LMAISCAVTYNFPISTSTGTGCVSDPASPGRVRYGMIYNPKLLVFMQVSTTGL
jgi:hypothetical protein